LLQTAVVNQDALFATWNAKTTLRSLDKTTEWSNLQSLGVAWKYAGESYLLTGHVCGYYKAPKDTASCACVSGACSNPANGAPCQPTQFTDAIDKCVADVVVNKVVVTVGLGSTVDLTLAISEQASIVVPSTGALSATTNFTIRPVAQSRYNSVANILDISRKYVGNDLSGFPIYMTRAATVLSPVFECVLPSGITFNKPFTFRSQLDLQRYPDFRDICLATIKVQTMSSGAIYRSWECVNNNTLQQFASDGKTKFSWGVNDTFSSCGANGAGAVYAFVHKPKFSNQDLPAYASNWLTENIVGLLLGLSVVLALLLLSIYCCCRLYRNRMKYKETREEADLAQEDVENMQNFGGKTGRKDQEIMLTENPMVASLNTQVDKKTVEETEAEIQLKAEQAEIRQKALREQRDNKDDLEKELARLQRELQNSTAVNESGPKSMAAPGTQRRELVMGGRLAETAPQSMRAKGSPAADDMAISQTEAPMTMSKMKTIKALDKKRDM